MLKTNSSCYVIISLCNAYLKRLLSKSLPMEKVHNQLYVVANYIPTLVYIIFFFHHLSIPVVTGDSEPAYRPIETIFLSCGSSGKLPSQVRNWTGDMNSEYFPLHQSPNNASRGVEAQRQTSAPEKYPYMRARVSNSQFAYTFNLTSGQKFIRLHFYADSYPNLDMSKAFFSVHAGKFILLRNFSVLLTAEDHDDLTFFKEYCVNVEENQSLNITFTPSPDYKDSFAFINGIEIVSMPLDLYYTMATGEMDFPYVGQGAGKTFILSHSNALEKVHRVNVGGRDISPGGDTGMFRTWEMDKDYLTEAKPSVFVFTYNSSYLPTFNFIKNYSAPVEVYQTARSMGQDGKANEKYRLTWEFPVDSGFTYLVRLHFCEVQIEIWQIGNRVFEIWIANELAEPIADVIGWSGGNNSAVYKDFAVLMGSNASQKQPNLSIALHPAPAWRTNYSDAILNGVEIFKVDHSGSLAAPNPDPRPAAAFPPPSEPTKPNKNRKVIIPVVVGVVSSFVVVSIFLFVRRRRIRKVKEYSGGSDTTEKSWWSPFSFSTTTTKSIKSNSSSLPSDLCTHFSLSEIKAATNNFDEVFIIGVGGFGNVYKGFIKGGTTPVAIKRLNPGSKQGALEFKTEIEMLSRLRYLHLVSLIGFCKDAGEMILVYDYMARGTVRDHLYGTDNPPLSWSQRLQICIGAARGLHYLHTGAKHVIIHRDVKTTNILLDEKWVAKVSDFGLSKEGPTSTSKAHVSTVVKGSFGYLDPEYYRLQRLTEKSDVYSFGVVLCEVLCARAPLIRTTDKKEGSLAVWARQCYDQNGTLYQIADPLLKGKIAPECLKKFCEVAMSCLDDEGTKRPSMSDVVWGLEFALQLQEEDDKLRGEICEPHLDDDNVDEQSLINNSLSDYDSAAVFSRIGGHVLQLETTTITTVTTSTSDDYGFSSKDSNDKPLLL